MMMKHKLSLPNRQCAMSDVSSRIQKLIVMFTTCMWAAKQDDELVIEAAIVLAQDLKRELTGSRVTNDELKTVTRLGAAIKEGKYSPIANIDTNPILMNYENQ